MACVVAATSTHASAEDDDETRTTTPPPETAAALPPEPAAVEEVTIGGARSRVSSPTEHRLRREEVRVVPGAFGDPFRAIDMLPGVVPTMSGLPYYYIRGAPPSAVGYFVDEVRVPYLFHFALGPSVIEPALIDEVSLHPAAFPARYGRYAGAIVAGKTREPASELEGGGILRLFDVGAWVEAPVSERVSVGASGRYSYTAPLFSLIDSNTKLEYRDYNARASYEINERWRASAFAFGAYDLATQKRDGGQYANNDQQPAQYFASEFHRLDLRLDRRGADGATSRIAMTLGFDRSRLDGGRFAQDVPVSVRARHRAPARSDLDVEIGADTTIDRYSGDLPSIYAVTDQAYAKAVALFAPRVETATGAWLSASWHKTSGFDLTATARADIFTSAGATEVGPSPRVSMRVPVTSSKITFLGALGIAPQPPAFSIPVPAVGYRGLPGGLTYGYQESAGGEIELPRQFTARAIVFHHTYLHLRDFRLITNRDFDQPAPAQSSPAQAYGLEAFVGRKLTERVAGFVSYTLSRSEIGATQTSPAQVSPFDRTHVLQLGGAMDLGAAWRASVRFLTYRGWPDKGAHPSPTAPPTDRLAPFYRIDLRVEKRWKWRKAGYIALVFEGLNVTASKEVIGWECVQPLGFPPLPPEVCKPKELGPIIVPSVGVEGAL